MDGINHPFPKNIEMALLFGQSLEILTSYHQPIHNNSYFLKYYLLPKKWLDKYKNLNNYNSIKEKYYNDYSDYKNFKLEILKQNPYKNEGNSDNLPNVQIQEIDNNFFKIQKYQIEFPKDFFPVKEEIFENSKIDKNIFLYELIIGGDNIFIRDNRTKNSMFVCSLNSDQEQIDDFIINVNYILIFNKEKILKEELNNIISQSNGFEEYCKNKNLNKNINEEQEIYNNKEEKIGIFLVIKDSNYDTPPGFFEEYLNIVNNKNNNIAQKNIINSNNKNNFINSNINNGTQSTNINFLNLSLDKYKNNIMFLENKNINNNRGHYNNLNNNGNIINNNQNFFQNNNNNYQNIRNDINNFNNNNANIYNNNRDFRNNYQNNYPNNYPNNNFKNRKNVIIYFDGEIYYKLNNKNNFNISIFENQRNNNNYYNNNNNYIDNQKNVELFQNNLNYNDNSYLNNQIYSENNNNNNFRYMNENNNYIRNNNFNYNNFINRNFNDNNIIRNSNSNSANSNNIENNDYVNMNNNQNSNNINYSNSSN